MIQTSATSSGILLYEKYKKTVYRVAMFPQCGKDQDTGVDTIHLATSNFVLNAPECACKLYISDNSAFFLSCLPETTRTGAQADWSIPAQDLGPAGSCAAYTLLLTSAGD